MHVCVQWRSHMLSRDVKINLLNNGLLWVTHVTGLHKVTGQDFFFSCPLYGFPQSFSSSYFLPLFHCLISILLFPCASVWENTRAWVPHFSIAILNWTCSLRAPIVFCGDVPAIKQLNFKQTNLTNWLRLVFWSSPLDSVVCFLLVRFFYMHFFKQY